MSVTSKIGALFFKHHQPAGKKRKKIKKPLVKTMPVSSTPASQKLSGRPAAPQAMPPMPLSRTGLPQRFEAVPDDLPIVAAPPPGTPALEEADTIDTLGLDSHGISTPGWCSIFCCRPCE